MLGEIVVEEGDLGFDHVEKEELAGEAGAVEGVEVNRGEPGEVGVGEEVAGGEGDHPLVEDGMDAVFDAGAVLGKVGAFGAALTKFGGLGIGGPDGGEETGAEELGEDEGIDFVGFDTGGRNGAGGEWVGDVDGVDEGLEEADEGPGVGGGFDGDLVLFGEMLGGEGDGAFVSGGEAFLEFNFAVVGDERGFYFFFVEIETYKWHTDVTPEMRESGPGRPWVRVGALETQQLAMNCQRRGLGTNGTYLFELGAQPGGPEGRLHTTAGSGPILVISLPQSVRSCSPAFRSGSSHPGQGPVSSSKPHCSQNVQGSETAGGVRDARGLWGNHTRYDYIGDLKSPRHSCRKASCRGGDVTKPLSVEKY